jgi:hypothetical protein
MWNKQLIALARAYASAVLTIIEPSGYPLSVRCNVTFDETREAIGFALLPALARNWQGKACLLFHRHNERLENQHELLIRGELADVAGNLAFHPTAFVTGTGSTTKDMMPHAGAPLDLIRFMLLGRRQARAYLRKRGIAWPAIDFDALLITIDE